ncbi:MAG: NAD(P)H-dependent flavin oxidoreductase [Anaerolineae bacterium]
MAKSILHTRVCDFFRIRYPIFSAGMGGIVSPAGPELAGAVSEAGGLGVIGGAFVPPEELRKQIAQVREMTDKPFGVDTLIPFSVTKGNLDNPLKLDATLPAEHEEFLQMFGDKFDLGDLPQADIPIFDPAFIREQLECILDCNVPVYVAGIGDPGFLITRAKEMNLDMKVGVVVGAVRHAEKSLANGVDFLVAQGNDGGGHNSTVGTMALIPQVVDEVAGRVPVLGAGGIMDGRGMVAALALGADGVWLGSAFLATPEARITRGQKQVLINTKETGTALSNAYSGKRARLIPGVYYDEFNNSGLDVLPMHQQLTFTDRILKAADAQGRIDVNPGVAGQGVGMIKKIRPAAEVLVSIADQAAGILEKGILG